MPKAAKGNRHEAELLYISRRLGETDGKIKPATVLKELKAQGRGYRKQDFLRDFAGIAGRPQTIRPQSIKGGLLSGIMRRKDVRAMPASDRAAVQAVASRAIDICAATGDQPWRRMKIATIPGSTRVTFETEQDFDDILELEHDEEVGDNDNLGDLDGESVQIMFEIMEHIYERLT